MGRRHGHSWPLGTLAPAALHLQGLGSYRTRGRCSLRPPHGDQSRGKPLPADTTTQTLSTSFGRLCPQEPGEGATASWVSAHFMWLQEGQFQPILASPRTVQMGKAAPAEARGAGTQLFPTFQMNPLAIRAPVGVLPAFPRGNSCESAFISLLERVFYIC